MFRGHKKTVLFDLSPVSSLRASIKGETQKYIQAFSVSCTFVPSAEMLLTSLAANFYCSFVF